MNLKIQERIAWSLPGKYCENYRCVVLGRYDQFMTHHESYGFEADVSWAKKPVEESEIWENAVPRSTRSVIKWAMKILGEWQAGRTNKKAGEKESGSALETCQDLETNICDMMAWISKILADEVHYGSMQRHKKNLPNTNAL